MPTESTSVATFTAGVVDRTAQARVDVRRLALGAKTQTNWLSHVLGYMSLRPGLRYLGIVDPPTGLPTRGSGAASIEITSTGVAVDADHLFAHVILLLHGEGTNGSQTFTDSSSYARTPSTIENGKVILSTAQFKYGSASIWGSGGAAPEGTTMLGWTVGPEVTGQNWCVEAWVRLDAAFDYFGFFRFGTGNNLLARFYGTGEDSTYRLGLFAGGSETLVSLAAIPAGTWTHVAITSEAFSGSQNTLRLFVDGVLNDDAVATTTSSSLDSFASTSFWIGPRDGVGFRGIWGYLDEYRVTLATRYTANFTPPTAAFPNS